MKLFNRCANCGKRIFVPFSNQIIMKLPSSKIVHLHEKKCYPSYISKNLPDLWSEEEIEITMTRADWKIFRKALRKYECEPNEMNRVIDLRTWIDTDFDDGDFVDQ